jgi:hypothetical protein
MKEHITKSGKKIQVWDNQFSFAERSALFAKVREIPFQFWSAYDTLLTDQASNFIVKSAWTKSNYFNFGFMDLPGAEPLRQELKEYQWHRAWVNLGTPIDRLRFHSDMFEPGYKSILYYINLHWNPEWHAPTVFKNNDLTETEYVSDFVPGRIVMFDSEIPHKGTHAPMDAYQYRFTLNSVWKKKDA